MCETKGSPHVLEKTLDRLNLCLKSAQMGTWEAELIKEPFGAENVKWDEEVARMHGVPGGQDVNPLDWFHDHVHPDDLIINLENNKKFFNTSRQAQALKFGYRMVWPNGEVHFIEMHGSVDPNSSTETRLKLHGVAKDITQEVVKQKIIEDQKNRLLAASRMAILGELSGGIAHEINNPLTVIQARAFQLIQMVETQRLDAAKIKSAAESISKTGDKIAKIVSSLRAFAHGQENEPFDKVNVRELVQETLDFCKVRFYNRGIDIRLGSIPEHLEFECRLIQMEEALLNVFNNAHDAISNLNEKWILIEAFDKDSQIEIHITDSGPGIPEEIAENMLLPFYSTKEIGKGMGLGLSIAAEIMVKHQGSIQLDRTNANTKFILSVPKTQKQVS